MTLSDNGQIPLEFGAGVKYHPYVAWLLRMVDAKERKVPTFLLLL